MNVHPKTTPLPSLPRDTTPDLSSFALMPGSAQPVDASAAMTPDTAAASEPAVCAPTAPLAIVSDFWLIVGEHLTELNAPTNDVSQPLNEQLIARGRAGGLNVRILSIEEFLALKPEQAPPSLALGFWAHGTMTDGLHMLGGGGGRLFRTSHMMEHGRALGAVAQTLWACHDGEAASEVAASTTLMAARDVLYDLRGGKQTSLIAQSIADIRDMTAYYADCKAQNICPTNVERYLQSQLCAGDSVRLVTPPPAGTVGNGTIGHFPGLKGVALDGNLPVSARLKPDGAGDPAIARYHYVSAIRPRNGAENQNLLFQRSFRGDVESVNFLVRQPGIHVNGRSATGTTALHIAATGRKIDVISALLQVPGIDVNATTPSGDTALTIAASHGWDDAVKVLIDATDKDGNRLDVQVDRRNGYGWTALYIAAFHGHASSVRALMQFPGIDIQARTRFGQTAFGCACRRGHRKVVLELLNSDEIRADVEDTIWPGMEQAYKAGHPAIATALLLAPELREQSAYLGNKLSEIMS
jgi:ankyrin repeat protein